MASSSTSRCQALNLVRLATAGLVGLESLETVFKLILGCGLRPFALFQESENNDDSRAISDLR